MSQLQRTTFLYHQILMEDDTITSVVLMEEWDTAFDIYSTIIWHYQRPL